MNFINGLIGSIPDVVAQGLIWGLVAIAVYISYKILDFPDMSVDSTIVTGAFVFAYMGHIGLPLWVGLLAAMVAGALAGVLTGVIHTRLGVPAILSGILTQMILYTVNIIIVNVGLGNGSTASVAALKLDTILRSSDKMGAIVVGVLFVVGMIIALWLFFYTEIGLTIKSTGDNPHMSRAQGVNVNRNKVIGLAVSNAIVALAGALLIQYSGSMDLATGRGTIVIGLAAIYIGLSVSMKIKPNFVVSLIGVVGGSICYFFILQVAVKILMMWNIGADKLKMISALIVAMFVGIPYLKNTYFQKKKPLPLEMTAVHQEGGDKDA